MVREYGVRWSEFNLNGELLENEDIFYKEEDRTQYVEALSEKPNFNKVEAYSDSMEMMEQGVEPRWLWWQ